MTKGTTIDSDDALVDAFRNGERSAFDALVQKYEPVIHQLVRRYVRSDEDAREVTQRAFVRAFERFGSFRGASSFRTWLHRLSVNVAIDHVRGEKQSRVEPLDDDVAFTNSLGTARLVAAELWRKVNERLKDLPPKQRMVVELRAFHDLSFEQIAAIAGTSEESARMNYHHAVKRLRLLVPAS